MAIGTLHVQLSDLPSYRDRKAKDIAKSSEIETKRQREEEGDIGAEWDLERQRGRYAERGKERNQNSGHVAMEIILLGGRRDEWMNEWIYFDDKQYNDIVKVRNRGFPRDVRMEETQAAWQYKIYYHWSINQRNLVSQALYQDLSRNEALLELRSWGV